MGLIAKIQNIFLKNNKDLKEPKGNNNNVISLFTPSFSGLANPEFNATYMACVQAHAKHISKIQPKIYRKDEPAKNKAHLDRILGLKPNPLMSAPQMWKSVATSYYRDNIAILFLEWDYTNFKEPLKAIWPLDFDKNSIEYREENEKLYLKFRLEGQTKYASIGDLIILIREADPSNLLGARSPAINQTLKVIRTSYEGMEQAIRTSAFIRFIVSSTTLLSPSIKKQKAEDFAKDYLEAASSNGVIYTDGTSQITKVESQGKWANADDLNVLKEDIYQYQGVTEDIIKGKYSEDDFQSYYESTLEPFLVELQAELTIKLFTPDEISKGNNVRIIANRLQNASLKTRLQIAGAYMKLPVYQPNVVTELLYLPSLENGDKEFANLNYVNADKQDTYQDVDNKPENPKDKSKNKEDKEDAGK